MSLSKDPARNTLKLLIGGHGIHLTSSEATKPPRYQRPVDVFLVYRKAVTAPAVPTEGERRVIPHYLQLLFDYE